MAEDPTPNLTALTVELLSAYVSNNTLASGDLSGLIASTHTALTRLDAPVEEPAAAPEYTPAVSIRKSIASREYIISLIDGKPYKTLKRHLAKNGLTIAEYRDRYNLPASYPTVAPAYSEHRRAVATKLGLGRRMQSPKATSQPSADAKATTSVKARKAAADKAPPSGTSVVTPASPPAASDEKPSRKAATRKPASPKAKATKAKASPAAAPKSQEPVKPGAAPRGRLKLALKADRGEGTAKAPARRSTRGKAPS